MKRSIRIVDSYKIWDIPTMKQRIEQECCNYLIEKEKNRDADCGCFGMHHVGKSGFKSFVFRFIFGMVSA